jgi:microcystin-dependent protein
MPWLTGDTIPTLEQVEWWCLPVPDESFIRRSVFGSLMELFYPSNWEKVGAATPEEVADRMSDFYGAIRRCRPMPVGSVVAYAGDAIPEGWLYCDGQAVGTTDYPVLFDILGYQYGGSGSTFRVPDMRGRVALGTGTGSGLSSRSLGETGGEETHQLVTGELPAHAHTVHAHLPSMAQLGVGDPVTIPNVVGEMTGLTGDNSPHENMPPFVALRYIILAKL